MKTALLISAGILATAVSFGQTSVKAKQAVNSATTAKAGDKGTQLKSATSSSTSADVHTNAPAKAYTAAGKGANKGESLAVKEKNSAREKASLAVSKAKGEASENRTVRVEEQSSVKLKAGGSEAKANTDAKSNNQAELRVSESRLANGQLKSDSKSAVNATGQAAAKSEHMASVKVKHMNSKVRARVHPQPATIKVRTDMKVHAGAGIKL